MGRHGRKRALVLVTIVVAVLTMGVAAQDGRGAPAGQTLRLGQGLGAWRLGMKRRVVSGLQRTTRNRPTGMGCLTAVLSENASLVDHYPGLRLGWAGSASSGFRLLDVASTRPGDRTDAGFVVGTSTLAQVQKRYPKAKVQKPTPWHASALGSRVVVVYFPKGAEFGSNMLYWFDSRGVLRAIETNDSGC